MSKTSSSNLHSGSYHQFLPRYALINKQMSSGLRNNFQFFLYPINP